jgi:hypothetical protein
MHRTEEIKHYGEKNEQVCTRAASTSNKQRGTSFDLSEFQFGAIKLTCNSRVHEPHIHIVNDDHRAVTKWFGTHIIMHGSKRSNLKKRMLQL